MSDGSEFKVTKKHIAHMLGVDLRSVTNFQNNADHPLPIHRREKRGGKGHEYDTREVLKWHVAKEMRKFSSGSGDGEAINYEDERARLTKEQADAMSIKNEEARRNLIPRWVLEWALENIASQIAAVLDSVKHEIKKKDKKVSSRSLDIVESALARGRNIAVRVKPDYSKLEGNN